MLVSTHVDPLRYAAALLGRRYVLGAATLIAVIVCGCLMLEDLSEAAPFLLIGSLVAIGLAALWRKPMRALYVLLFASLCIEQWPIPGLDPITAQTHFFQSFTGFTSLPAPLMPADVVLAIGLLSLALTSARPPRRLRGGLLVWPVAVFALTDVAALIYGAIAGPAGTTFFPNAAWSEARAFLQLCAAYLLAVNLITRREHVVGVIWILILSLAAKGVQGVLNYVTTLQQGVQLQAITGHEDVVFFGLFFVLLASMAIYGSHGNQLRVMLVFLPPLLVTELATSRRSAFLVLLGGFGVLGLCLMRDRPALVRRIVPPLAVLLCVYTAVFWDQTSTPLGQPVRAFRSQFEFISIRDLWSNEYRHIEDVNIADNIALAPITGLGFGRPYHFFLRETTDLTALGFLYWTYMTHNAIYWVWMKMGIVGFIAFWCLLGTAIVRALIFSRQVNDAYLRAVAIAIAALIVMQLAFSYVDLGLTYSRNMILLGLMLGLLAGMHVGVGNTQAPTIVRRHGGAAI
jgi:hypothetical protein